MMQHTWVFQLSRSLTDADKPHLQAELDAFLVQWKSHGSPVPGTAEILFNRFIVIQAVPGTTSGCSIDAMTKGVEQILAGIQVQILGADTVFYLDEAGQLQHLNFRELDAACREGRLKADSVVFDSSLGQKGDIRLWQVKLRDTWMARYLPKELA